MPDAPPDAAVARFRRDFLDLGGALPAGVAVSGGPDSLALLLLCATAFPGQTLAATVDHGLREESRSEARFVSEICRDLQVPHTIIELPPRSRGNVSDWARSERYAALNHWADEHGIASLLTAHHADDQLETLVMRLNRGSGVAGLSGIRARQGRLLRPLLGWRHDELVEIVSRAGLTAVDDPSNRDDRFDRARLRKKLAGADWLDPIAASRSAAALAQADAALEWSAEAYFARRTEEKDGILSLDPRNLPAEILRRLVLRCLAAIEPEIAPRGEDLQRLLAGLIAGKTATLGGVRCSGGEVWRFSPAPPRRKN